MRLRIIVLLAVLMAASFGGPAAAWSGAGHGPCGTADEMASAHCDETIVQDDEAAGADAEGCVVMSACSGLPALGANPAALSGSPPSASWALTASDQVPAGHISEPFLEPPIILL